MEVRLPCELCIEGLGFRSWGGVIGYHVKRLGYEFRVKDLKLRAWGVLRKV